MSRHSLTPSAKRFLLLTLALLVMGLLALYSASTVQSFRLFGSPNAMFLHQLLYGACLGLLAVYITFKVNYGLWQKFGLVLLVVAVLLLIVVHAPGWGIAANGAVRWLSLGPLSLQPGEVAKIAAVIYVSSLLAKSSQTPTLTQLVPALVVSGIFCLLLIIQPDMGTAAVLFASVASLFVAAGVKWKSLAVLAFLCLLLGFVVIQIEPYRASRLTTFLNPSQDPLGAGYQMNQAFVAVGSGGLWGYGYGLSRQKHNYLPEPVGDSIFAIVSEEMGFVRVVGFIGLFLMWLFMGLRIAVRAPNNFAKFLACGLIAMIGVQALVNSGSIVGLLPLTGIPFPFFSYGSSALIITLGACGILLNIAKHARQTAVEH